MDQVGVLVFVHQDVVEPLTECGADGGVGHCRAPVQQEILEVEEAVVPLARGVGREDRAEPLDVVGAPREPADHRLLQWHLAAHHAAVDRSHGLGAGKAGVAVRRHRGPDQGQQIPGVALSDDTEAVSQSERRAVAA